MSDTERIAELEAERDGLRESLAQARMHQETLNKRITELEAWKENGKGYVKTLEANERVAKNRLFETQNQLRTLTEKHNDTLRFIEAAKATYGPKTQRELDFVIRIGAAVKERDAARQSRKRAVLAARELRERLKNYEF